MEEKIYTIDHIVENNIDNTAYGFIYITSNSVNGKGYIGQRKFSKDWKYYLGSGRIFTRAIQKYGKENFVRDIVAFANSIEDINNMEIELIKRYNASNSSNYYNIGIGGEAPMAGLHCSEGHKMRLREAHLKNNWGLGLHHSQEHKAKISKGLEGRICSLETRQRLRDSINVGKFNKENVPWNKGIPNSLETRQKISNANTGKVRSE